MKGDSDGFPVVWMPLILLICVLKMIKMVIWELSVFYHNKNLQKIPKIEKASEKETTDRLKMTFEKNTKNVGWLKILVGETQPLYQVSAKHTGVHGV